MTRGVRVDKLSEHTKIRINEGSFDLDGYRFFHIGHSILAFCDGNLSVTSGLPSQKANDAYALHITES